jgi:phosphonate transport system substrate-binding protein
MMDVFSALRRWVLMLPLLFAALAPLATVSAQSAATPFTIGVLPNLSARVILANYQPMRDYMERELKRPVEIYTAGDFRSFNQQTQRGEFALVVTAANLGRVAQIDAKWEPLACYEPKVPGVIVALASNLDSSMTQLRGKALAVANPPSAVAVAGLQWLAAQGLQAGADFKSVVTPNDDSLGAVLMSGEAPLAVMSLGEFRAKPEALRNALRIVTEFAKVPGFLVMANPTLPSAERQRLKALLLAFAQSEEGRKFQGLAGVSQIREVGEAELKTLDAFNDATRKALGG